MTRTRTSVAVAAAAVVAWIVAGSLAARPPAAGAQQGADVGRMMAAAFSPQPRGSGRLFILAIGSDARAGQAVDRTRADSLHVIGVDLEEERASILGIPRDAYVPIPGAGTGKINASLFFGGPELTVRTVEALAGIPIDGYVLTGFTGFQRMIGRIGGVEVRVPYRMRDGYSGAHFRPGPRQMDGDDALAFARNRHDVPRGDFGRSLNQGRLLVAALRELRTDAARDPATLLRWTAAAAPHLRTDLSIDQMLDLLLTALRIDPARVRNEVVPGGGGFVGEQSVVRLGGSARAKFRDLRRDGVLGQ
jgi:polyisoprenyl-teichoic acid--peptidoglycan teichoic acid transferase